MRTPTLVLAALMLMALPLAAAEPIVVHVGIAKTAGTPTCSARASPSITGDYNGTVAGQRDPSDTGAHYTAHWTLTTPQKYDSATRKCVDNGDPTCHLEIVGVADVTQAPGGQATGTYTWHGAPLTIDQGTLKCTSSRVDVTVIANGFIPINGMAVKNGLSALDVEID